MKNRKVDHQGARAFARKGVEDFLRDFPQILVELMAEDHELVEHLTRLSALHAKEPPLDPHKREDLVSYELSRAWREGLAPSGYVPKLSPYEAEIESLITAAASKPVAYTALSIHMAEIESNAGMMIPQLRVFQTDILRETRRKPPARGTPKVHPARNKILYALVLDIVDRFGIPPTRNKVTPAGMSACDIVAEAMPNDPRLPKSYSALEQIWLNGRREKKKSDTMLAALLKQHR